MRILFAGTPQPAVASLDALVEAGHQVVGVLTRTDAKVGRKRVLTPSPVAMRAAELGLPIIKANSFNGAEGRAAIADLQALQPDIGAVVAYGGLLPQHVLEMFPNGWVNLHFSLLPAYRGAAPVQWAIINQEQETGAAVFQLETGLDTGPVYATLQRRLDPEETAGEVLADLSISGGKLLATTLFSIADGTAVATVQEGKVSWAPKITRHDTQVDAHQPANAVQALINGVSPVPGAWAILEGDETTQQRLKIGRALPVLEAPGHDKSPGAFIFESHRVLLVCHDGVIELTEVQPSGKKMMRATDWARGVDESIRLHTSATHPNEFDQN